jgi:hypothetical protein
MLRPSTRLLMCVIISNFAMLLSPAMAAGQAAGAKTDMAALVQETQKMSRQSGQLTVVWWFPEEFWKVSVAQDPNAPAGAAEQVTKVVHPYLMAAVVEGKIGPFGGVTYSSESSLKERVVLKDSEGNSYAALPDSAIQPDAQNLLQVMKPMIANLLGSLGQNLHFVLFPAQDKKGHRIAEATEKGSFSIAVGEEAFKWRLPLDSLLPTLICPQCKAECRGSWSYCPYCGTRLK